MTLVLPVLVAVFGLLSVYGRQGWLATLCGWLGVEYGFSPYGLQGILLAHLFFNLPLATRPCCRRWRISRWSSASWPPSWA